MGYTHRPLEVSMGKYLRWVLVGPLGVSALDGSGWGVPGYGDGFGYVNGAGYGDGVGYGLTAGDGMGDGKEYVSTRGDGYGDGYGDGNGGITPHS